MFCLFKIVSVCVCDHSCFKLETVLSDWGKITEKNNIKSIKTYKGFGKETSVEW